MHLTRVLVVSAIAACGSGRPAQPTVSALVAKTPDQQCELLAPRLEPCDKQLVAAQPGGVTADDNDTADFQNTIDKQGGGHSDLSDGQRHDEVVQICVSSLASDAGFSGRVVQCWNETSCAALMACIKR